MRRLALMFVLPLVLAGTGVEALQTPRGNPQDDRVRTIVYDPYNVTKIVGVIRTSTQVMFAEDEEIAHVALGDAVAWEVAPAGNILFLKPRERHPTTNLQVVTTCRDGSRRSYQFELSMREGEIRTGTDTYFLVRFQYPSDEAARARAEADVRRSEANARCADEVRHITRCWIPFAERRGLEDMTPGPTAYLAAKAKGDCSMPSKRERSEDADDPVPQGPRDTVRTELFEPQPPAMQAYIPRHSVLRRGHHHKGEKKVAAGTSPRGGADHIPFKGADAG